MTSDSAMDLSATEGFNGNTKCTWQIVAKSESAPQFCVSEAPTSQFLVHFIEWSDEADMADTMLAESDLLPAVDTAASTDLKIG